MRIRNVGEQIKDGNAAGSERHTLFARLPPTVAQSLYSASKRAAHVDTCQDPAEDAWDIRKSSTGTRVPSGVEFLPLMVTFDSGQVVYVSYNGGDVETEQGRRIVNVYRQQTADERISHVTTAESCSVETKYCCLPSEACVVRRFSFPKENFL